MVARSPLASVLTGMYGLGHGVPAGRPVDPAVPMGLCRHDRASGRLPIRRVRSVRGDRVGVGAAVEQREVGVVVAPLGQLDVRIRPVGLGPHLGEVEGELPVVAGDAVAIVVEELGEATESLSCRSGWAGRTRCRSCPCARARRPPRGSGTCSCPDHGAGTRTGTPCPPAPTPSRWARRRRTGSRCGSRASGACGRRTGRAASASPRLVMSTTNSVVCTLFGSHSFTQNSGALCWARCFWLEPLRRVEVGDVAEPEDVGRQVDSDHRRRSAPRHALAFAERIGVEEADRRRGAAGRSSRRCHRGTCSASGPDLAERAASAPALVTENGLKRRSAAMRPTARMVDPPASRSSSRRPSCVDPSFSLDMLSPPSSFLVVVLWCLPAHDTVPPVKLSTGASGWRWWRRRTGPRSGRRR